MARGPPASSMVRRCRGRLPRGRRCGSVELLHAVGKQLRSPRRPVPAKGREVTAFQVVVGDEEIFDLVEVCGLQVCDGLDRRTVDRRLDGPQEAIIAECLPMFRLLGLDHAHQAHGDQAARKQGLLSQDKDVERITVCGRCRRNEPEVRGKGDPQG